MALAPVVWALSEHAVTVCVSLCVSERKYHLPGYKGSSTNLRAGTRVHYIGEILHLHGFVCVCVCVFVQRDADNILLRENRNA